MRWLAILLLATTEPITLRGAFLSGAVRDAVGNSIERVVVWAVAEDCLESQRAVSDEQGHYSFPGLPPGKYLVFATRMGFRLNEKTVRMGSDRNTHLDLQLEISGTDTGGSPPSTPLRGLVTDAAGHPIAGASIHSFNSDASSGSDGRFGLCRVMGTRIKLRIEHQNYVLRTIKVKLAADQALPHDLKIKLRKR